MADLRLVHENKPFKTIISELKLVKKTFHSTVRQINAKNQSVEIKENKTLV